MAVAGIDDFAGEVPADDDAPGGLALLTWWVAVLVVLLLVWLGYWFVRRAG